MSEISKTASYEINSSLMLFKKLSTWINICAVIALVGVFLRAYIITVVLLMLIILLKSKQDYESGEVIAYYRKKQGIPNKTMIRNIKLKGGKNVS